MKILNACKVGMALTAAAFLGITSAQRADAISFSITDLGTLGGDSSSAYAINEYGQVVGSSNTAGGGNRAFLWDKSSGMINLDPPRSIYGYGNWSGYTYATAINDLGQVVGNRANNYGENPFFWDKSSGMIELGPPRSIYGYAFATAINNLGQMLGNTYTYFSGYGQNRAFVWEKGSDMINLGTLGSYYGYSYTYGTAINDYGQVVGYSSTTDGDRAFLWEKSGGMTNLGTLGGNFSAAYAINNLGQVVGQSNIANGQNHAFLWEKSSGMTDLGTLGDNGINPIDINNLGQVIGYSYITSGQNRPFFWEKSSGISDLNDLVSAPGWTLNSVVDINNAGQIVGRGFYNGQQRAFLLTPNTSKSVPEPSSALAFLALGAVGAGSFAKRQRQQHEASNRN
ncbi:PEP-CTERM sorting domain-containing protein [Microseira sp. BLCC-F43]|jgi:probable HAF family extracellular repeat protein|uniref:PEP-CTERM sorting domain-containing protein n=1 Tax=Microseira sp. BLCC-F43 TaxID=3153602 RepID=UPI0035B9EF59